MRALYLLPVLMLTACGYASPTWMPAGYAYHNDVYKAQPGPAADSLGYAYTPERNDQMIGMWAEVAAGLVNDLESQTGISPQPVYLEKLAHSNAFNLSLDNALRDELRARGYMLKDTAQDATQIKYQAFEVGDENKGPPVLYNGDEEVDNRAWKPAKSREFVFVLTLFKNGAALSEARSIRPLPAYGYVHGEGTIVPSPRVMEAAPVAEAPAGEEISAVPGPVEIVPQE
ncbi:MAG: hypothetical protein WBK55_07520 [Alphaproteobacteria bacterium]